MKRQILLLVAFLFAVASYAQETTFVKGEKVLNLGIGLGSTLYSGSYYNSKIPPISVSLEYGVVDDLLDVAGLNVGVAVTLDIHPTNGKQTGWEHLMAGISIP